MPAHWWNFGEYNGNSCPNCGRERMLVSTDDKKQEHVFCDNCFWEPATKGYLDRDDQ
jgi:hypothetical protein